MPTAPTTEEVLKMLSRHASGQKCKCRSVVTFKPVPGIPGPQGEPGESSWSASTPWTPTVNAGSGSFTSVSASGHYRTLGKIVFFYVRITITDNGTAGSYIAINLPLTAANIGQYQIVSGRETSVVSKMLTGAIAPNSTTMYVQDYTGAYIGANGYTLDLSGEYESV